MKNYLLSLLSFFFFTSILFSQTLQWQKLNGPFGGSPLCFVSKGSERFAGMDQNQGGVFRSSDDETAWGQKSSGIALTDRAISWLAVDDSGYIIAGTNSHIGAGVYKSKDNGESWVKIANLGGNSVAQNDSGHIYVGNTAFAQYSVSKDGGYTWVHYPSPANQTRCITINDSGHIFIGGNYTGYRSTDNGTTWTNLPLPDGINSFAFAPNGDVYAGCSREYAANSGVYKSTDNGNSWTPVKEGFRVEKTHNIAINIEGDIFVGSYGWGIWRSTDDGVTWTQPNSGLHHFYIISLYILDDGNIYVGTLGGGIYRSTDNGESWQQTGVTSANVKALKVSPANGTLFASVVGMSRSTDGGVTWEPMNSGISQRDVASSEIKNIAFKSDGTIFIGYSNNGPSTLIYRSTNNGSSWVLAQTGVSGGEILGLAVDDSGYIYASTDHQGVYKSTNNGDNWFKIRNPSQGGKLAFNSVGDLFLAGWGAGVWKLPKGDTVWVNITGSIYPQVDCIFIGSNNYIYAAKNRSTDNGVTWTSLNIPVNNVYSYTENSVGHLFCGTYNYGGGVYRSTNFGETWEPINSGLPALDDRCVAVDANDYLYAGPWGYSLYKTTTSTVTSVENENELPTTFYLEQNYPSPFNLSTKIRYNIPNVGSGLALTVLKVYDVLGNDIATLVNEHKSAGTYEVEFSAIGRPESSIKHPASGIYFYQLRAGEFVQTKKMVLIK